MWPRALVLLLVALVATCASASAPAKKDVSPVEQAQLPLVTAKLVQVLNLLSAAAGSAATDAELDPVLPPSALERVRSAVNSAAHSSPGEERAVLSVDAVKQLATALRLEGQEERVVAKQLAEERALSARMRVSLAHAAQTMERIQLAVVEAVKDNAELRARLAKASGPLAGRQDDSATIAASTDVSLVREMQGENSQLTAQLAKAEAGLPHAKHQAAQCAADLQAERSTTTRLADHTEQLEAQLKGAQTRERLLKASGSSFSGGLEQARAAIRSCKADMSSQALDFGSQLQEARAASGAQAAAGQGVGQTFVSALTEDMRKERDGRRSMQRELMQCQSDVRDLTVASDATPAVRPRVNSKAALLRAAQSLAPAAAPVAIGDDDADDVSGFQQDPQGTTLADALEDVAVGAQHGSPTTAHVAPAPWEAQLSSYLNADDNSENPETHEDAPATAAASASVPSKSAPTPAQVPSSEEEQEQEQLDKSAEEDRTAALYPDATDSDGDKAEEALVNDVEHSQTELEAQEKDDDAVDAAVAHKPRAHAPLSLASHRAVARKQTKALRPVAAAHTADPFADFLSRANSELTTMKDNGQR